MAAVVAGAIRRNHVLNEWLAFCTQVLIAISVEVGDDLSRGAFAQHGTLQGVTDAQRIVTFEAAHGLWVEPSWQLFFQHTHHVLALTITWSEAVRFWNGVYVFGHIFVTLGVALWMYVYRRQLFGLLRNVVILTNVLAIVIYESFPVAPPRMTTGLVFDHHPFTFQDTLYGILEGGKVVGTQVGYNEFSAMPSVHMAWALIVGGAVVLLARPFIVKTLGMLYPCLMLIAIVVTGNHYLLDAIGAVVVVALAVAIAVGLERGRAPALRRVQLFRLHAGIPKE